MGQTMFIVIVGCGRLGSHLANRLSHAGHSVVAIDVNDEAFANLESEFSGFRVSGDATELSVLKEARIDKADLVIATTREDNVNLMAVQVAKRVFKVPRILARVYDPRREEVYRDLGVHTICPTTVAADLFLLAIDKPREDEQ